MTAKPRSLTVLGSTGSVGCSTLDLVMRAPGRFAVEALTAGRNAKLLAEQARAVGAKLAVIADEAAYGELKERLTGTNIAVAAGVAAVDEAAAQPAELVMSAIVGVAGLSPTLTAIRRGACVAFASKECLVSAGPLMMAEIARCAATLLPVDSEHNAIFQVFNTAQAGAVERIILTASGGPFRTKSREHMRRATPAEAVAHPNWSMGAKISVDSATMMNKGLEIIEAFHLFDLPEPRIEVLVHPQSVIHSMVAYVDGSVLAQLGPPDMRTPIAHALAYPERMPTPSARLDLAALGQLTFEPPDPERFPALRLAREALRAGGSAPTILNAANEVAVAGFLGQRLGFLDIVRVVEETLSAMPARAIDDLDAVREIDAAARRHAEHAIGSSRLTA
ncbi:MAG TPA: 1-deoxy-D-xylulose-5-phosphate reductoisomerase [Candidatus Sulfotelmatobacter sp.]|nr:1-deoxy-D-xylulose-5-phosphate reductoisomerase [Candidatus Sulfotelmatobacter sp.]